MKINIFSRTMRIITIGILSVCSLLITSCSFGTPSYSKQFRFELGEKHLEIDVDKYCTYEIGISFLSEHGDKIINEIFGHARHINMPAMTDIFLTNEAGQEVFSRTDFGGHILGYRYGPNPLKLVAGTTHLEPGKYTAIINVRSTDKDLSYFESEFFISANPKITCGRKK